VGSPRLTRCRVGLVGLSKGNRLSSVTSCTSEATVSLNDLAPLSLGNVSASGVGRAGYIWPVLRALLSHQDQPLRVRTRREEAKAQWVVVTRIKRYAGGLILVPQADVHQPSLYVIRFVGSGPLNRLRQLSALALGLLRYDPAVHLEPADWVRIEGNRTVPVQIDGEVLGELPLEISFHPKHLRLVSIPGVASIFTS
jgi:diacylglycerol kinase family enzyme